MITSSKFFVAPFSAATILGVASTTYFLIQNSYFKGNYQKFSSFLNAKYREYKQDLEQINGWGDYLTRKFNEINEAYKGCNDSKFNSKDADCAYLLPIYSWFQKAKESFDSIFPKEQASLNHEISKIGKILGLS